MSTSNRPTRHPYDELDDIDPTIPAGTTEYWKARARQWQHRCQRAEREKTELIAELQQVKGLRDVNQAHRAERRAAILQGDLLPGRSGRPKAL